MTFVFALGFALMVLIAGVWQEDGVIAAFLIGLGLGAWLTALMEKRMRRITGEARQDGSNVDAALEDIHWRLKRLENQGGLGPSPMEAAAAPAPEPAAPLELDPWLAGDAASSTAPAPAAPPAGARPEAVAAPAAPTTAREDGALEVLLGRFRAWLLGGNTVVRVGIVVLFFGVAFLLRFAAERAVLPLELRVAGIGAGAIVLLVLGWRLRQRREAYALALQGAGVGLLYLTLFGAFRLYQLVPPLLALLAMVTVSGLSALLALLQNSRALMSIGVTGGFLAPVLASTGTGSHIALFSYYAVLNLGIFAVAWFKAWRPLNLLGFFFTFGIGLAWGMKAYRTEYFASTEAFLLLFFAMFLVISVLFARRQSENLGGWVSDIAQGRLPPRIVDATLVFGLPLVAFGFQAALTQNMEFALAYSALGMAALYLGLARWLHRQGEAGLGLLVESFLALGVIFATLAVPLALDARWTSASWSLEGAALVWVGLHQQRRAARIFGLLLQLAAALAWLVQPGRWAYSDVPVLNAFCLGALLIALAGLFSAWQLQTRGERLGRWEKWLALPVFFWGLLWWLVAGMGEGDRLLSSAALPAFAVLFLALSAAAFQLLERRLAWSQAGLPGAGLVLGLGYVFLLALADGHALMHKGGWLAWPAALLIHYHLLRQRDEAGQQPAWSAWVHALGFWLMAALGSHALARLAQEQSLAGGWSAAALVIIPGLLLFLLCREELLARWPLRRFAPSYLGWGAWPLLAAFALWWLIVDFDHNGDAAPLPYLPLLNPVDLAHGLLLVAALRWSRHANAHAALTGPGPDLRRWTAVPGVLVFIWLNAVLLRSIHHWAGIPYELDTLLDSTLVQAALSLFWTVLALALMAAGTQRGWRQVWMAGAALMAVVVLKLFLVDLDRVGSVARIVSFMGVGLLMLLIGYLAPVPPRTNSSTQPEGRQS